MTRRLKIDDLTDLAVPSQPALSPDGDRVVYVLRTLDAAEDRNVDQLWTVPTSGGTPRRLTTGNADTSPAWSPDGSRIAFVRDGQVHLLATDGGEPEQVTDLPLGAGAPVWSPDGARLAFTAPVDPGSAGPLVADRLDYQADGSGMFGAVRSQVHVVDLASGECRQVTDGTEHAGAPAWSPDGSTIAFTRAVGEDSDLRFRIAVHLLAVDDPKALPRVVRVRRRGRPHGLVLRRRREPARRRLERGPGRSRTAVPRPARHRCPGRPHRVPGPQRDAGCPGLPGRAASGDGRRSDPVLRARARVHPPLVGGRRRLRRQGGARRRRSGRVGARCRRRPGGGRPGDAHVVRRARGGRRDRGRPRPC